MRPTRLFLIAAILLIIGIGSLASGWHGTAGLDFGIPMTATHVTLTGGVNGARALIGLLATFAGVILFFIALITALIQEMRPSVR